MSEQSQDEINQADWDAEVERDWRREQEWMELEEHIALLRRFNEWRRGADSEMLSPRVIGKSLDAVLDAAEGNMKREKSINEQNSKSSS